MEQKLHHKCSWAPARAKAKSVHRQHLCDLIKLCRKTMLRPERPPYTASLQECVSLLHELLGCPQNIPRTCTCRAPSMQISRSPDAFLCPVFQFLGQCEELSGLCGASGSPFQLLTDLFFQMDSPCCWCRLVTDAPRLQELLSDYSTAWMLGPRQMHYPCGACQAAETEGRSPVGKSQECHNPCMPVRRPREHRRDFPAERLYNLGQAMSKDLTKKEVRSDQRPRQGYLPSVRELKNSLKIDLVQHQLFLMDLESRLSGLERRTQDVTRSLEKANLELKAIKRGSVTPKSVVGQQMSSPEREDLHVLDSPWERWAWSEDALRSDRWRCDATPPTQNKRCRRETPAYRGRPADGGGGCWSELQTGISLCQDQVNILIQQITRQINWTETDENVSPT